MLSNARTEEAEASTGLAEALKLCYKLRLSQAADKLEHIIEQIPTFDDAHSALALIRLMQGRTDEQTAILERTLDRNPNHYLSRHQLALAKFRDGQFRVAYNHVQFALAQKPSNTNSLLLASRLCLSLGNHAEAYQLAEKALGENNDWQPQACNLMAEALIKSADPEELYKELMDLIANGGGDEARLKALCRLAQTCQHEEECLNLCEQGLTLTPDNKPLRLLRVSLLAGQGRYDDCFPDLFYLLSLEPTKPRVLYSLAETLLALKRHEESLQVYLKIARITGTDCLLLNQIGACYRFIGRFRSAEKAYWRALRLNPLDVMIISNLGDINFRFGDFERALELYSVSLRINPLFLPAFYNSMLAYSVGSPEEMTAMRKQADYFWTVYRGACADREYMPLKKGTVCIGSQTIREPASAKLRLGILSADIGDHCVSFFATSFLKHYNRDKFHVELILCNRRYEQRELEICSHVDHCISLEGLSENMARNAIKERHFDIIIECNGYTGGTGISLLAERCAPIQCHYIGYHASTGLDTIDFFISDNHILSKSVTEQLSEKPLMLDRGWLAFHKFEDFPGATSVANVDKPLLGFFGNSTKITAATLEYWSALFQNCPGAILVLKCPSYKDRYIAERVLSRIESVGIQRESIAIMEPTASWTDHLRYYNLIDYALDSTPWSSATTGFDALGMGVPLLAIEGETIAARMSSSLVSHLGHPEWIATTPSDYAMHGRRIAEEFMQTRREKTQLQIEVQNSSLFDGPGLARSLEKALLSIQPTASTN